MIFLIFLLLNSRCWVQAYISSKNESMYPSGVWTLPQRDFTHIHIIIMSRDMRFPTMWYVRPAKPQISLRIRAVCSEPLLSAWIFYDCSATNWTLFRVSKLKRGLQTGSSESTLVKMPHCWKSHVAAHIIMKYYLAKETNKHVRSINLSQTYVDYLGILWRLWSDAPSHVHSNELKSFRVA